MKKTDYISQLIELSQAEKIIRKGIDTYTIDRTQRDSLFKQLGVINDRRQVIYFKMQLNERIRTNEKSRKNIWN